MPEQSSDEDQSELVAPLSGQIINISVSEGESVVPGQELIVLTAMKMENIITSERICKISKIMVSEMDSVSSGQVLIEFE